MNKVTVIIILLFLGLVFAGYWALSLAGVWKVASPIDDVPAELLQYPTPQADDRTPPPPDDGPYEYIEEE